MLKEIMEPIEFKAFVVEEKNDVFIREIKSKLISDLPKSELLIKVHYSSLNYKDALSATGHKGVTRKYTHTPGIDAVGTVVSSKTNNFKTQDKVIVPSYDLGMNTDGGFGQYIRVPESWVIKLPENLSMKEAMTPGTAELTAEMSVLRLTEAINKVYNLNLEFNSISVEAYINEHQAALGEFRETVIGGIYEGIKTGKFAGESNFFKTTKRTHKSVNEMINDFKSL